MSHTHSSGNWFSSLLENFVHTALDFSLSDSKTSLEMAVKSHEFSYRLIIFYPDEFDTVSSWNQPEKSNSKTYWSLGTHIALGTHICLLDTQSGLYLVNYYLTTGEVILFVRRQFYLFGRVDYQPNKDVIIWSRPEGSKLCGKRLFVKLIRRGKHFMLHFSTREKDFQPNTWS